MTDRYGPTLTRPQTANINDFSVQTSTVSPFMLHCRALQPNYLKVRRDQRDKPYLIEATCPRNREASSSSLYSTFTASFSRDSASPLHGVDGRTVCIRVVSYGARHPESARPELQPWLRSRNCPRGHVCTEFWLWLVCLHLCC